MYQKRMFDNVRKDCASKLISQLDYAVVNYLVEPIGFFSIQDNSIYTRIPLHWLD